MFCNACITQGNLEDFDEFPNEVERLKDFAGAFASLTSDYDGCESAEDLKKFIDELTLMVKDTIIEGQSVYDSRIETEEETKRRLETNKKVARHLSTPTSPRKRNDILGEDFGVIKKIPFGKGLTLRVENDDWGYFITVVDKNKERLHLSHLIVWKDELPDEIAKVKELFK